MKTKQIQKEINDETLIYVIKTTGDGLHNFMWQTVHFYFLTEPSMKGELSKTTLGELKKSQKFEYDMFYLNGYGWFKI